MNKDIFILAVKAALAAGKRIMHVYTDPDADFQIEKKADNSPLTIADRKAHEIIAETLKDTPYPVLSEEGKKLPYEERKDWNEMWIVDPLDGTKEFIKRNGEFTVNIAYVNNHRPEAGVIYIPVKKELYIADCEWGAYKLTDIVDIDDTATVDSLIAKGLHLPLDEKRDDTFIIVASRSHLSSETEDYINKMKETHTIVNTISAGSSLKLCLIAEGKADVYPRFAPTMEWDTAAGHAIIRAAGKEVYHTDADEPLHYNKENLLNPWFIAK